MVDKRLRDHYGISSGTVQSVNSLRGAALVGGALLASLLRGVFPSARITESHPKALLIACYDNSEVTFANAFQIDINRQTEHERDAAIAAVCAREGFEGRWCTDLAEKRYEWEQDPQGYWLSPMCYFWPESV